MYALLLTSNLPLWLINGARTDHEFTQLMKQLQGERLRQAFKHFDQDQDGLIRPEQFKRIILVSLPPILALLAAPSCSELFYRKLLAINYLMP